MNCPICHSPLEFLNNHFNKYYKCNCSDKKHYCKYIYSHNGLWRGERIYEFLHLFPYNIYVTDSKYIFCTTEFKEICSLPKFRISCLINIHNECLLSGNLDQFIHTVSMKLVRKILHTYENTPQL